MGSIDSRCANCAPNSEATRPAARQHRPHMPSQPQGAASRHGRHALHARSAQRLQQQCFGLVFAVMRRQQALVGREVRGERRVARVARRGLDRRAGRQVHRDGNDLQRNVQVLAKKSARVAEFARRRLQAMIDVQGAQRLQSLFVPQRAHRTQQRRGIGAAAQGHHETGGFLRGQGFKHRVQGCRGKTHGILSAYMRRAAQARLACIEDWVTG